MNLFLIGYRGAGKTTVARMLANRLNRRWIDTDAVIEDQNTRSIAEIFQEDGERGFREIESATIARMAHVDDAIVAMGGGSVLDENTCRWIAQSGKCVWLRCAPDVLNERLSRNVEPSGQRPALTDLDPLDEIRQVLADRLSIYDACADYIIDCDDLTVEQTADQIALWLDTVDK